jgi:hypothetical protein
MEKALPPKLLTPFMERRSRRHQVQFLRSEGFTDLAEDFVAQHGMEVKYGPFKGLLYSPSVAKNRIVIPKLLGTYEQELHGIIKQVQSADYDVIVDVGCAEGYYSTGFALTTRAQIVAFDAEKNELAYALLMARTNKVESRIQFQQWCSPESLAQIAESSKRLFVLSDCEGYEEKLFAEETAAMAKVDVLIELHGNAKAVLVRRFQKSHRLQIVKFEKENRGYRNELDGLPSEKRTQALNECREYQEWLWAEALSPGNA